MKFSTIIKDQRVMPYRSRLHDPAENGANVMQVFFQNGTKIGAKNLTATSQRLQTNSPGKCYDFMLLAIILLLCVRTPTRLEPVCSLMEILM